MSTNILFILLLLAGSCISCAQLISNAGNRIAVLASGDITDFGYSNTVNTGRIIMEQTLNISGSLWVAYLENQTAAWACIQQLVPLGYTLIVSSTSDHGSAALMGAQAYPNVSFVQAGGSSTLPNLSVLNWVGSDMYYSAGIFAGALTKNNKIGFIHPGPQGASIGTLNAFYTGAKWSNPNVTVYSVYTGSYLDPDVTTGACNILLNQYGVDQLAGQQDDFTLQVQAMAKGLFGIGLNGYSLREIYGETIGMSVLRNWGGPLTILGNLSLAGVPFRKDITASFASGYTYLDQPSYLVPQNAWQDIQIGVTNLEGKTHPYYCNPWVAEMGLNTTTGCLINSTVFSSYALSEIVVWGTYAVPLEELKFPASTEVAIIVIAGILIGFTFAIAIILYYMRRDTVMLASSPIFMGLILTGCTLVFIAAIIWSLEPDANTCAARIWLASIGFTLSMGAMIIKNVRLWLIFDAAMRKIKIRDAKLLGYTSVLLAGDILLLGLWIGLGRPHSDFQQAVDGLSTYQIRKFCATTAVGDQILYAILAYHVAQLAVGCFVTFKIRVIDIEEFNESRPFGLSIYIVSLVFTIAGILIGTTGTTNVQIVIIFAFSLLIGGGAVLFVLFVPKFLTIFVKGSRPIDRIVNSINKSRSKGSSSTNSASVAQSNASPPPKKEESEADVNAPKKDKTILLETV